MISITTDLIKHVSHTQPDHRWVSLRIGTVSIINEKPKNTSREGSSTHALGARSSKTPQNQDCVEPFLVFQCY